MASEVVELLAGVVRPVPADTSPVIVWHAGEAHAAPVRWFEHTHGGWSRSLLRAQFCHAVEAGWRSTGGGSRCSAERVLECEVSSIDGPQHFHDGPGARAMADRRGGSPVHGLKRLQDAGFEPRLSPCLVRPRSVAAEEYHGFYRDHGLTEVSFSIDGRKGPTNSRASSDPSRKAGSPPSW